VIGECIGEGITNTPAVFVITGLGVEDSTGVAIDDEEDVGFHACSP
jgi:hypothetical protein